MPRAGKVLTGVLVAVGVPAAVAVWWRDAVAHHPVVAVVLALAWEVVLGVGSLLVKAAGRPANRRLEQVGDAVDRALGRRLSRYGRRYRQYVLAALRFIDAKGLATAGDSTPELDAVFVDVSLAPRAPHQVPGGVLADVPVDVTERHSIWDFLDHDQPSVIAVIGAPGSGKTTLLRHVARRLARTPRRRRRPVPILLELRDHTCKVTADPAVMLPQLLRDALPVGEPPGWWEHQLQRGRCIVLLDGLDEVATADDQRTVADWIDRQVAAYPRNDYVVTSRPHGYRTAVIASARVLQVRAFTDEQVAQFLYGWYRATERHATGTSGPDVDLLAKDKATDLLERLAATPALYDLTINPLLLTMIANVHRYRGALPGSRADLYGEVCQVMLWRRQEAKRIAVDLPGPGKERLLAHLAYTMMRQRVRDLPRQQVLDTIRPGLKRASTTAAPEDFLADVSSNGLLIEREKDLYAVAHHTFQEYLAAQHIRDKNLSQTLIDAVDDVWWREATLLYVAGADADPIVRACLDTGTVTALSLAFDCTEDGSELAPDLRQRLNQTLAAAFGDDATRQHRRLVAGVLTTRHLRKLVATPDGSHVCPRPITTGIYRLFLRDTQTPAPDGPCPSNPNATTPVTGVWRSDALAFMDWVNTITAGTGEAVYRLPTPTELDHLTAGAGPAAQAFVSMATSVWTTVETGHIRPQLWTSPSKPSPLILHDTDLPGIELHVAMTADIIDSDVVTQLLLFSARTRSHVLARTLARTLTRNLDLARGCDYARFLVRAVACGLAFIRTLADDVRIAYDLSGDLAHHLDRDRSLADDLDHVYALARDLDHALDRALALNSADALAYDLGLDRAHHLDRAPTADIRSLMGSALADALNAVTGHDPMNRQPRPPHVTFTEALLHAAGICDTDPLHVSLDALAAITRQGCTAAIGGTATAPWASTVARRLVDAAEPVFARRRPLTPKNATAIRLAAFALAGEADQNRQSDIGHIFRTIAAGVTLLQHRAGTPTSLETLILARA